MSYNTAESALITILTGIDGFSTANVKAGDYRCLKAGITKAIVLQPGPFTREHQAFQYMRTQWTINIELYIPFGGEMSTVASNIRSVRQEVIDHLDKYPTLDGTAGIVLSLLQGAGEPEVWNDGRKYLFRQVMSLMVEERGTVEYAE